MADTSVCGYSLIMAGQSIRSELVRIPHGQLRKFAFTYQGKTLARFDTEEKGRLYMEAFNEGLSQGYQVQREQEARP